MDMDHPMVKSTIQLSNTTPPQQNNVEKKVIRSPIQSSDALLSIPSNLLSIPLSVAPQNPETIIKTEIKEEPYEENVENNQNKEEKVEYQCDLCDKRFRKEKARNKHEEKYHSFVRNENLEDQQVIPEKLQQVGKEKPKRSYVRKKNLHEEKESAYNCNFCDKTFNSSENRTTHEQNMHPKVKEEPIEDRNLPLPDTEQEEKPPIIKTDFYCEKCDKYLAKKDYLTQHKTMVHFECEKCKKIFDDSGQLLQHTKTEHKVLEYKTNRSTSDS